MLIHELQMFFFLLQNVNPKPNEILVGLRCDLTNLERDTRAQISEITNNLERDMLIVRG